MDKRIKTILEYGIMAPSGDNCQPWKFKIDGLNVDLYNDPDSDTSLYNLKQRASLIAHGALLETIRLAAPSVGLQSTQQLLPDPKNINYIARLSFNEGPTTKSDLFKAIPKRHTNRERYQPVKISDGQIEGWRNLAKRSGEKVWIGHQSEQIFHLAELLSINDRLVFEVADLHRFLFEQIRWSDNDAQKTGDGLDIKTLGLNTMDRLSFPFLKNHGLISILNKVGFSRIVQLKSGQLLKTASAIAVVTIPGTAAEDYILGGMLWQRLLLQLASDGLNAQPIAGLACLIQAGSENLLSGKITQNQKKQLSSARKELLKLTGCDDSSAIIAMFRIGLGPQVTRSLRRPLVSFILS